MKKENARLLGFLIVGAVAAAAWFLPRRQAEAAPAPVISKVQLASGEVVEIDRDESERIGALTDEEFRAEINEERKRIGLPPRDWDDDAPNPVAAAVSGVMKTIGRAATAAGLFSGPSSSRTLTDPTLNAPRPAPRLSPPQPAAQIVSPAPYSWSGAPIPLADKEAENAFTGEYDGLISEAAAKYDIPAPLLKSTLIVESGLNPKAVSSTGARGIAQFFPAAWEDVYGEEADFRDRENPADAIPAAAAYMSMLRRTYGEQYGIMDWPTTLQAYNAGLLHTKNGSVPPEAVAYSKKILALAGDVEE